MSNRPELSSQYQSLETLVLAGEESCRALERGEVEIEYRGTWIQVEDNEWGWEYVFNGRRDELLEQIFEETDVVASMSKSETKRLAEAWQNRMSHTLS
jgi:hypothetical protein